MHKWIEYASQHNIQHLYLSDCLTNNFFTNRPTNPRYVEEDIPDLFSCLHLVTLNLGDYILTSFPTGFLGFPNLISCYLSHVQMTDDSLASLVSFCPLLRKLVMTYCLGLIHAVISSSFIEDLNICEVEFVLVDCSKLKGMDAFMIEDLRVNGTLFYELSYAVSHLEMYCGDTLRELWMESTPNDGYLRYREFPARFLDIIGNFQSLKKLHILLQWEEMAFPLFKLFHRLPNLQMFSMFGLNSQVCSNIKNYVSIV